MAVRRAKPLLTLRAGSPRFHRFGQKRRCTGLSFAIKAVLNHTMNASLEICRLTFRGKSFATRSGSGLLTTSGGAGKGPTNQLLS